MDVDRPLNKWTAAAGIPLTQRALPARFKRLRPPLPNPPYTPSHPNHPTPSFSHQADSLLRRVYLGTADQGLLNISKVKSVIHRGDKRSLLGPGPIFEETFHACCRSMSVCVCECFFFCFFFVICQLFSSLRVFCCTRCCGSIRCGTLMIRRRR